MTLQRAVELLLAMKVKHGDIEVMFDCEHCGKSTRPTKIVAMAVAQSKATAGS